MKISDFALLAVVGLVVAYGLFKKCDIYNAFVTGAKSGFDTAIKIVPQLVGLLVAIKMFSASGAMEFVTEIISPAARLLRFPKEALPFAILRPVSGSGSLAMATEIFKNYGADSFAGRVVSVMMGSTETTFYVASVYFGAVGIKNSRHAVTSALLADFVSMVLSVVVCSLVW